MTAGRPPITAIVVTHNEADKLRACLASLAWCDERIVVDLGSADGSAAVARELADRVLSHPFSPIVEPVRCFAAPLAKHDWLLFVDPDEQFPLALADDIAAAIRDHPRAGVVRLPWQFYFKGERLDGTVWGGPNHSKKFLFHRGRATLSPLNHRTGVPAEGYEEVRVAPREGNHVRHDWIDSYAQLVEKHWRYACKEGEAWHRTGGRFWWRAAITQPMLEFKRSLIDHAGWRIGLRGWVLSFVYAAYRFAAHVSLWHYQRRQAGRAGEIATATTATIQARRAA